MTLIMLTLQHEELKSKFIVGSSHFWLKLWSDYRSSVGPVVNCSVEIGWPDADLLLAIEVGVGGLPVSAMLLHWLFI